MKTLLLCFVHGFKGGDDTFGSFPNDLQRLLTNALSNVTVRSLVYPKFETRGDLAQCVSRFRDWLEEKVIDLEVQNATPSPTIDPSVRTILIGHSMGGIVAADTLLSLTSDQPIESSGILGSSETHLNTLMFPYVQGVLAFDTPYLGISPGVVAHGAEEHYNAASSAITQLSGLAGGFWGAKAAASAETKEEKPRAALPAPPTSTNTTTSAWGKWSNIAIAAGSVAAVAGAGAAAFVNRDKITEGFGWASSHLEFVGCLMKGEDLRKRVNTLITLNKELHVGWANLYTRLGQQAVGENGSMVGSVIGNQRTFCNLPKSDAKAYWYEAINDAAKDETGAHTTMFYPKDNPGYHDLAESARNLIVDWTTSEWYESNNSGTVMGLD